jgi:hypothetical protein
MKLWFAKFRISTALDAKRPLSSAQQRAIARSGELRQFKDDASALDRALKDSPSPEAPPELHDDIMRAVRSADRSNARPFPAPMPRWTPATALAALALLGAVWFTTHRADRLPSPADDNGSPSLTAATTLLHTGSQLARATPAATMEPLLTELESMQSDLNGAAQFLLASLP